MKKLAHIFYKIFIGIGVVVMAIFYTILSVIQTPFRAADYRKSLFARETGADYEAGVTETLVFKLYNRLRISGVAVEALTHPKHPRNAHLLWNDTLIIHEIDRIALRDGRWVVGTGSSLWKEGMDLKDAIAEVLEDVFDDRPGYQPGNALLLVNRTHIAPEDRLEAEAMPLFLLYDNEEDLFEILRRFCK